ncbi:hypothetical protein BCR44DRAFT_1428687 [Catenaria anguillulae PL171]|uniref:Uncharacterized protein n=1 Tax=Catenaria anguillulae PL171 TaxID=765915 RepID=A0A1Y2HVL7_9FUNG|nr:hypothetical protein BCR44DRAFT_1428687 [Catenaria anguillulae PL171]
MTLKFLSSASMLRPNSRSSLGLRRQSSKNNSGRHLLATPLKTPKKPSIPTTYVYHSCIKGAAHDSFTATGDAHFPTALRSTGTQTTAKIRSIQNHVTMKWDQPQPSRYISFSLSLSWSIYNQLKHEYMCGTLGDKPRYTSVCTPWTLYALEVPTSELHAFDGRFPLAKNMTSAGELQFGYLQILVKRYAKVVIASGLRQASIDWFAAQFDKAKVKAAAKGKVVAPTYPYRDWLRHISKTAQGVKWVQVDTTDPVKLWRDGEKSDAQVAEAVNKALAKNPVPERSVSTSAAEAAAAARDMALARQRLYQAEQEARRKSRYNGNNYNMGYGTVAEAQEEEELRARGIDPYGEELCYEWL